MKMEHSRKQSYLSRVYPGAYHLDLNRETRGRIWLVT